MCDTCKEQNITELPKQNYTLNELKLAAEQSNKRSYSGDEIAWFYNLYNRVFNTNRQPGCGKCFANIRRALNDRYNALK